MKFKFFTIPCCVLVATTLLFSACSKEGPVGPAGTTGPQGPAGPQGPKGDTGTANVIYSDWLNVTYTPDTTHNGNVVDTVSYTAEIAAPLLTSDILSKGEIKVYLNIGSADAPTVVPLPLDPAFGTVITPLFGIGKITLISLTDASTQTTANGTSLQYRYILIPGGTAAGGTTGRMAKVNWDDYNQVKTFLDLKN